MTCHTTFPRLNYYGELFMKNGYQDPFDEKKDGSELRKKSYGSVDLTTYLGDLVGARASLNVVGYDTHGAKIDNKKRESSIDVGEFKFTQLFVAGSIFKNVSFFDEIEFDGSGNLKHGWARVGFHNIFNTSAINFFIGKVSPADFTTHSDRLRLLSNKTLALGRKSSLTAGAATAEAESSPRDGQNAIQYYGSLKGLTWSLGTGNGSESDDANGEMNYWGSLMFQAHDDGPLQGSGASLLYYDGTDTTNSGAGGLAQIKNEWYRVVPGINVRYEDWDVIASWTKGEDKNDSLSIPATKTEYQGKSLIVSRMIGLKMHAGFQYDDLRYERAEMGTDQERISGRFSYLPRENFVFHFILERDLLGSTDEDDNGKKYHDTTFTCNMRTMF